MPPCIRATCNTFYKQVLGPLGEAWLAELELRGDAVLSPNSNSNPNFDAAAEADLPVDALNFDFEIQVRLIGPQPQQSVLALPSYSSNYGPRFTIASALLFPVMSTAMGGLLHFFLPSSWTTPSDAAGVTINGAHLVIHVKPGEGDESDAMSDLVRVIGMKKLWFSQRMDSGPHLCSSLHLISVTSVTFSVSMSSAPFIEMLIHSHDVRACLYLPIICLWLHLTVDYHEKLRLNFKALLDSV